MQDNIVFLHICHNPKYFSIVKDDYFEDGIIKCLYGITKSYYDEYKQLPFKIQENDPLIQIKHYIESTDYDIMTDELKTREENINIFYKILPEIINYPYDTIDQNYLVGKNGSSGSFGQWLQFKAFTYSLNKGLKFLKLKRDSGDMKGENVGATIKQCLDIINAGGNVSVIDDDGKDFDDASAHRQLSSELVFKTGFESVDRWCGEDGKLGGLEPGEVTLLWGASNVGKSIWAANFATNFMMNGNNVLFVSNEMRTHKIMKRMGSNVLNIDINKYGAFSSDINQVERSINAVKKKYNDMLTPWGKLRVIKIPKCTPSDVEYKAKELEKKLGIKFHVVIIDYFTNMGNDHGVSPEKMYTYHKTNAEDLCAVAERGSWHIMAPHQIKIGAYSADDMTLSAGAESSGVIHPVDNIWGIVQSHEMKMNNQFQLKNLKSRDSGFKDYLTSFSIAYNNMRITGLNDMIEPEQLMIF